MIGLGAAAYSPAKLQHPLPDLPHRLLVVANGNWIEASRWPAIIVGTVIGA